jgi:hypothetical protein
LGTDERAYPTAQNLCSVHTRRLHETVRVTVSASLLMDREPSLSFVPSPFPHLVEPQRWRQNNLGASMGRREATEHTAESLQEKLERQQREREQMRLAIAAYSGPVTRIPQGKTAAQAGIYRRRTQGRIRNAADDQKGTTRSLPDGQSGI